MTAKTKEGKVEHVDKYSYFEEILTDAGGVIQRRIALTK